MYPGILSKNQLVIVKRLKLPKTPGFYLGGGTALALQIDHRTSVDFDFYCLKNFDSLGLAQVISKTFPNTKVLFQAEDTLRTEIGTTELSFFYYPYTLLKTLNKFDGLSIASPADIAAMKLAAIVQRGTKRDFIDVYFLLNTYSLEEIISFALKKYPSYHTMLILRALIYFEDAEKISTRELKIFDPNFSWQKAKGKIFKEVKKYQLSILKKH